MWFGAGCKLKIWGREEWWHSELMAFEEVTKAFEEMTMAFEEATTAFEVMMMAFEETMHPWLEKKTLDTVPIIVY